MEPYRIYEHPLQGSYNDGKRLKPLKDEGAEGEFQTQRETRVVHARLSCSLTDAQ